jgi:hypothetical protein
MTSHANLKLPHPRHTVTLRGHSVARLPDDCIDAFFVRSATTGEDGTLAFLSNECAFFPENLDAYVWILPYRDVASVASQKTGKPVAEAGEDAHPRHRADVRYSTSVRGGSRRLGERDLYPHVLRGRPHLGVASCLPPPELAAGATPPSGSNRARPRRWRSGHGDHDQHRHASDAALTVHMGILNWVASTKGWRGTAEASARRPGPSGRDRSR